MDVSFDQAGGTIGRLADKKDNHLFLPDPDRFISRIHVKISFTDGNYYLTDTSIDGTFHKNRDTRIHGKSAQLADGDRIWIGDYELSVQIYQAQSPDATANDALGHFHIKTIGVQSDQPAPVEDNHWWPGANGNHTDEFVKPSSINHQGSSSPLHEAFSPPDIRFDEAEQREQIPADFNFKELIQGMDASPEQKRPKSHFAPTDSDHAPRHDKPGKENNRLFTDDSKLPATTWPSRKDIDQVPDETPVQSPADDLVTNQQIRRQTDSDLIHIFMEAAGVKNHSLFQEEDIPHLMETLGVVFREMVTGLVTLLKGRSEQKIQLRMSMTQIMPEDNNPLKFFNNIDETVEQLLTGDKPGFIDIRTAVRDGYAEIMNHHLAMTTGIQAAVIHLIEQFDPLRFSEQHKKSAIFAKKAKLWDAFQRAYAEIANTALDDFFGEALSRAYQAQLFKLQGKSEDPDKAKKE
jgi:type VI secretion system FHA domain protein